MTNPWRQIQFHYKCSRCGKDSSVIGNAIGKATPEQMEKIKIICKKCKKEKRDEKKLTQ
jgi:hypothetical protein